EFGGKRTGADARGVRLDDTEHVIEIARTDAGTGRSTSSRGVRRGHVGIGAQINVEQRALRTLEQDAAALAVNAIERLGDIRRHRRQLLAEREVLFQRLLEIDRLRLVIVLQHEIMEVEDLAEFRREAFAMHEIPEPHRTTRYLVLVRGADAA